MEKDRSPKDSSNDRAESRAKSLESDQLDEVADSEAQASRMLEESDQRTEDASDREEDDDTIERRTSEEASGLGKGAATSDKAE